MIPTTAHESARQHALDTYRILDSLPEAAFDDIVQLASVLCDAPIALVSLIDRDRQWSKAKVGLEMREAPRDVAFCDHAIRTPGMLMEVPNLAQDDRFADNPLVSGPSSLRFYAGMPLVTPGGAAIGTVCVIDSQPRTLTHHQRAALESLARLTMNLLDGHNRERVLARAALVQITGSLTADALGPGGDTTDGYTVAIFEMQDFAGAVARIGERAVEKVLQQLDQALEACLRSGTGDIVNRVTGSPEFTVVLQGTDTEPTLQRLRYCLAPLEAEAGICVLVGAADAGTGAERMEDVFGRADDALTTAKDARAKAASG